MDGTVNEARREEGRVLRTGSWLAPAGAAAATATGLLALADVLAADFAGALAAAVVAAGALDLLVSAVMFAVSSQYGAPVATPAARQEALGQ
ncbi:hypothetical protein [Giesbergeria anulus]|uniref:hypothetical protein n=1 Tax=Giesbergeria anulus TaxID=180197 RepID=UPI001FDEFD3E|nr:hypothetical protein [Giesbergeria anulus]